MGTLAIVIGIYLVVTTLVTCLLFLMDGAAVKEWAGTACGENYYALENYHYGSPCWEDGGHFGEGFVKLIFLPFYWFSQSVSALKYAFANFNYYLPSGKLKRVEYIKNFVEKVHRENNKHFEGVEEDFDLTHEEFIDLTDLVLRGRTKKWNIRELIASGCYEKFSEDYLIVPRVFWLRTLKSFLILFFWPFTIVAGYGYLGFNLLRGLWDIMSGGRQ